MTKRLSFLYGGKASISCYNGYPNGAVIEIKLPYQEEENEEEGATNVSNINR
ncbi:hypothetical protein D3C80_1866320 [compost metagenome]